MLFVIHATDKAGSLELRQTTRPSHLSYVASFNTPVAGPMLNDEGVVCGSCIFLEVPGWAEAEAFVEADPYNDAGLFQSVTIREFKTVVWPT